MFSLLGLLSALLALATPTDAYAASISIQCGKTGIGWTSCPALSFSGNGGNPTNSGIDNNIRVTVSGGAGDSTWALETPDGATWTTFTKLDGSFGNTDTKITASRNEILGQSRSGTIRFYERETNTSVNLSVKQAGGECQSGDRCLMNSDNRELASGTEFSIPANGGSVSVRVFSNFTGAVDTSTSLRLWSNDTADSVCPGITVSGRTITASGANNSGATRTCLLAIGDTAGAHQMYTIIQNATNNPDGTTDPNTDEDGVVTGDSASDCNAGKFGWALCPIMEGIDNALDGLYGFIESNFLQVDIAFYRISAERVDGKCPSGTSETDSGVCQGDTYRYWQTFRNIANIVFVIIFLVIILSQVTSVGISNYGIKKMLPEIIIAALLINLSYFICQALVDVSNIVGVSIRDFLGFIVDGSGSAALDGVEGTQSFLNTVAVLAGASAAGFTVATILSQGVFGLIAAILVVLLTALVAIFMMFVILVVRQIAVILLIVLAPLAFAARILPNTANLFRNWWKAFSSLLVVYPMCSLVIGLGAAAATIMGSQIGDISTGDTSSQTSLLTNLAFIGSSIVNGNFSQLAKIEIAQGVWIAATVLAMVVPYFAVIPLCKGALNGLGKLGGMITGGVTNAGAGINRLGRTGAAAAQKKYDQSAGRQARLASAKAKAQEKAATKASDNRGTLNKLTGGRIATTKRSAVDKMLETEYNTAQKKDASTLASLGQYIDDGSGSLENRRLMRISAANAKRLGVNPDGTPNGTQTFAQGSWEEQQQMSALTARQQQDAKAANQFKEQFAAMSANGDVETAGNAALASGSYLQAEQAISDLLRRGDVKAATKLTRAYTNNAHYSNDTRAQQRLANILQTGENKKNAARLWALGKETNKAIAQGNKKGITLDAMTSGTGVDYKDASGTTIGGSARTLQTVLHDDFSVQDVAGQDKDTFEDLSSLGGGNNFSADKYVGAYTSGAAAGKIAQINAAVRSDAGLKTSVAQSFSGSDINKLDNDAYAELSSDFSDKQLAGALTSGGTVDQIRRNNAAIAANPTKMADTAKLISATQMQNLDDSSFVMMAKHQLQATYASDPAKLTALNSAATISDLKTFVTANAATAQPVLQSTFSSAYNSANANKDVAKHWNADVQQILDIT
jgi:hypothetical protein